MRDRGTMRDTLIPGLWLALIVGMPAVAGVGSYSIGLGLLVIFLASGVAPAMRLGLKAKAK